MKLAVLNPIRFLALVVLLTIVGGLLAGCQVYQGYPTEVATLPPTVATTTSPVAASTVTPRATLPPPATATLRPTLPAIGNAPRPAKADVLKQGLDVLLNSYFIKLSSADVYDTALQSLRVGLSVSGVASPDVPLPNFTADATQNWNSFLQSYTYVIEKYKSQITEDVLVQYILAGVTSSFRDCQTTYVPTTSVDTYLNSRVATQTITGVGVNLQSQQNGNTTMHVVVRPITGSPADKAGLKAGDQITAINDQDTTTRTRDEVIRLLQGATAAERAPGTKVKLTIKRDSTNETKSFELNRAQINIPFLERQTLPNSIGYLRFARFPLMNQADFDNSTRQLDSWLREFEANNTKGLVVDLRGVQPGDIIRLQGFLSFFINGPELVFLSGARTGQNNAREYGVFPMPSVSRYKATALPLAVLVDGGTTAEGEVFAHAIQKNSRGKVVGENTAGCLSGSRPTELTDKALVNVTVYQVVNNPAAADNLIEVVVPDQNAPLNLQQLLQGKDSQLEEALKLLPK